MTDRSTLDRLSLLAGIEPGYRDAWGQHRAISDATRCALLRAMGLPATNKAEIAQSTRRFEECLHDKILPDVVVVREKEGAPRVSVTISSGTSESERLEWTIEQEGGENITGATSLDTLPVMERFESGEKSYERRTLVLPQALPLGYHRLTARLGGANDRKEATARLIMVPSRCYEPPSLEQGGRRWGFAVQLYGLRSKRNWGMGDFTDLITLIRLASRLGAAVIGLAPLHALFPEHPAHASPYSPSSRLFLNTLYIDVEAIDDYRDSRPAMRLVSSPAFQERLHALREARLIDYEAVSAAKMPVLELLFQAFSERLLNNKDDVRVKEFRAFQKRGGSTLKCFATFQALSESIAGETHGFGWHNWGSEFHDPNSGAVARFALTHEERINFYEYLQWQAERQLASAMDGARRAGMSIGLYHDLAVGADGNGAEAWNWQDLLVWNAGIGAPPDAWNLKGQNWGLPPFNPLTLQEKGYAPFIELLRDNMRRGGALRIDHILGLMRLYWIPSGDAPGEGAYVAYPWRDLLGIVALESRRNRCLVIGEDLGTVPEGLREALAEAGILSYRLFYFEKTDGSFSRPEQYPSEALVAVGTHDLPTLSSFWQGADIALRDRLALWPTPQHRENERRARDSDRAAIRELLAAEGLLKPGPIEPQLAEAVYAFLARTPCRLLMVQLEDVIGQIEQVNVPGTVDQHPNWRQRLAVPVEDLFADSRVCRVAERLQEVRGDRPR